MLTALRTYDHKFLPAYLATKSQGLFACPECNQAVALKTGSRRIRYFAHVVPAECRYTSNESNEHRRCKMEIFEALQNQPNVKDAALERPLGTNRPDVSAVISGVPVAIEVQISSLSLGDIIHRTREYTHKGIYVLWLLPWTPKLDRKRYTPELWEKWLHTAYFGRVYYWTSGLSIVAYRFEPSLRNVPQKTFYVAKHKKKTVGGYSLRSKRHRTAIRGEMLNLATDFVPKDRDWWDDYGLVVPACKIFIGRYRPTREQNS